MSDATVHANSPWTLDKIERLRALWEGPEMSQAAIGKLLGVSKSAVNRKRIQLKLCGRQSPIKPRTEPKPLTPRQLSKIACLSG